MITCTAQVTTDNMATKMTNDLIFLLLIAGLEVHRMQEKKQNKGYIKEVGIGRQVKVGSG